MKTATKAETTVRHSVAVSTKKKIAASAAVAPGVRVQVAGTSIAAILVGSDTYVSWKALQILHTPYDNLGGAKFALTGQTVQGVVYDGLTYLPWNVLSAQVKANPLKGGGFNFTAVAVKHDYHVEIDAQSETTGSPAPLDVAVLDGENGVPAQKIQIQLTGGTSGTLEDFAVGGVANDVTDENGQWMSAVDDANAENLEATVKWTDPSGHVQSSTANISFTTSNGLSATVPANDSLVATVPITTFQNAVLFTASSSGNPLLFQLDTGAFEPLLTSRIANQLHLPNLGSIEVAGVGGEDNGYYSKISLSIGGVQFGNVPCVVDPSYTGTPLLGYGFFIDNGYDILVSQKYNSFTILS